MVLHRFAQQSWTVWTVFYVGAFKLAPASFFKVLSFTIIITIQLKIMDAGILYSIHIHLLSAGWSTWREGGASLLSLSTHLYPGNSDCPGCYSHEGSVQALLIAKEGTGLTWHYMQKPWYPPGPPTGWSLEYHYECNLCSFLPSLWTCKNLGKI